MEYGRGMGVWSIGVWERYGSVEYRSIGVWECGV